VSIAQDCVTWLNHRSDDLIRIKRPCRFGQYGNERRIEVGSHAISNDIQEREGVTHKVAAARELVTRGEQNLNLSWAPGHVVGTWCLANAGVGEGALTTHMPVPSG
jgi:hypothetical protein